MFQPEQLCSSYILSLDEGMIPCKNHLAFTQYLKDKPVKWGIKSFLLTNSTNEYVLVLV